MTDEKGTRLPNGVVPKVVVSQTRPFTTSATRAGSFEHTPSKALWVIIKDRAEAIGFGRYKPFVDSVMCESSGSRGPEAVKQLLGLVPRGNVNLPDAYEILKKATELFLMQECGMALPPKQGTADSPAIPEGVNKFAADLRQSLKVYEDLKVYEEELGNLINAVNENGFLPDDQIETAKKLLDAVSSYLAGLGDSDVDENAQTLSAWLRDLIRQDQDLRRRLPYLGENPAEELKKNRNLYLEWLDSECRTLPYFNRIRKSLGDLPLKNAGSFPPNCYGILKSRVCDPCFLELIWSYWHEEGMLVQGLNAISLRFQNRALRTPDPLFNLDLDPLRPLNHILWGYIQDEWRTLSLKRRSYEYDHHYGLRMFGKAAPRVQPSDSRSKFIEAYHNLLHLCTVFYKELDDTTVIPDAFVILNALKEVHLLLAEGAHNQYGDLPWNARMEMLIQQWILARPEIREFLRGRIMVPYREPWMGPLDTLKRLQGWTDITSEHFRNLGVFGEEILLTIRFGDWNGIDDPIEARQWAEFWRTEIQGYIHAYRVVTGVDLSAKPDPTLPGLYLQRRLRQQARAIR